MLQHPRWIGRRRRGARRGRCRPTCSRSTPLPGTPNCPVEHRQREDGGARGPTVARPLEPPTDAEVRRPDVGQQTGQPCDDCRADARHRFGRARASTRRRRRGTRRRLRRARARNARSSAVLRDELARDRQREHDIGPGPRRDVQVGALRHRGAARVDDDELRARLLRAPDQRREVRVADGRVRAPDDDQLRVDDVERVGREHVRRTSRPTPCRGSPRRSCRRLRMRR